MTRPHTPPAHAPCTRLLAPTQMTAPKPPPQQVKSRPPTFVAFMTGSAPVDDTFSRFLSTQLREALDLGGTPLRFWFR